ncbi:hypothetical protein [Nodosilinea nodulosa]|uniref:hypothetical protein n=1 Tax=Nodosilinea nodulosa TaxID=416001 RepID=UPI0012D83612|nr:hypothetical protein [Nodosilinea nodulosa]
MVDLDSAFNGDSVCQRTYANSVAYLAYEFFRRRRLFDEKCIAKGKSQEEEVIVKPFSYNFQSCCSVFI